MAAARAVGAGMTSAAVVGGGVYPGWGTGGWYLGGLYRVLPGTHPGPIFSLNLASGPYPRPYEGQFSGNDEVSQ